MSTRLISVLFCMALVPIVSGCGQAKGTVKGTVKVEGVNLKGGLITFLPEDAANKDPCSAQIQDGQFDAGEVPVGKALIVVTPAQGKPAPEKDQPQGNDLAPPPKTAEARVEKGTTVPEKYASTTTSGLSFIVKAGPNTYDVDLKP